MKRRVVVTGLGAVTPIGNTVDDTWASIRAGKCGVGPITQFDASNHKVKIAAEVKDFDPSLWIDRKEARKMARFTQFVAVAAAQAIADS
ncbi:MAG: beta-ketoacyl-[acyl-carrier-protein] synthase II, partial [Treponema sp.]|nr:beta-ketoacyl-[acyl-carrier-protein] synthase II [Treponema sp.]